MNPIPISAEQSPLLFLELLYKLRVRDVMVSELITVPRKSTMRDVQIVMRENRISGIPVVENKRLFGLVSVEDLIEALDQHRMAEPVENFMASNVVTVEDDMPLSIAISYFNKYDYHRLPVLNRNNEPVGIITSRSVNTKLLLELFNELARIENQNIHPATDNPTCYFKTYPIKTSDFENAGKAATEIKNTLQRRGIDPKIIRRVSIAAYELEINLVVHSLGGTLTIRVDDEGVHLIAKDKGPGIANVELAMQEGWTTANEWVKSLGFGAGMGLPNAKRVSDEFHIESQVGVGTTVAILTHLPKESTEPSA